MRCPYHLERPAKLSVPKGHAFQDWIGWMEGCCELPVWMCSFGDLHPIDARYCQYHGCQRPPLTQITHELASGKGGARDVVAPTVVETSLEFGPSPDGKSTPCIAGNLLVYLTEQNRLVALDFGTKKTLFLAQGVAHAAMGLRDGAVVGALQTPGGVRYHSWDLRSLREGLEYGVASVAPKRTSATGVHLVGLPSERSRRHVGAGLLRLVVEHDPLSEVMAELYRKATGEEPGHYLIRRTANPLGPHIPHPDLRPQALWQVPVPVPGGVFMLGTLRVLGRRRTGALLIPTVGGYVA